MSASVRSSLEGIEKVSDGQLFKVVLDILVGAIFTKETYKGTCDGPVGDYSAT